MLHELAILQHVRHAGRATQVVLQHVDLAVGVANQVGARDVAPDAVWRFQTDALRPKSVGRFHHFGRYHAVANDPLLVIDVVQQHVERDDSLHQSAFDPFPFVWAMIRGTMSNGIIRSAPWRSPYTLNVMPSCTIDRSAARWRRIRSSRRDAADAIVERLAIGARTELRVKHFIVAAAQVVIGEREVEMRTRDRFARFRDAILRPPGDRRLLFDCHTLLTRFRASSNFEYTASRAKRNRSSKNCAGFGQASHGQAQSVENQPVCRRFASFPRRAEAACSVVLIRPLLPKKRAFPSQAWDVMDRVENVATPSRTRRRTPFPVTREPVVDVSPT